MEKSNDHLRVRTACEADIPNYSDKLAIAFGLEASQIRAQGLRDLADKNRCLMVATLREEVIAVARVTHYEVNGSLKNTEGYFLLGLWVEPSARRRGIGKLLTVRRMDWVNNQQNTTCHTLIDAYAIGSLKLHEDLGFRHTDTLADGRRLLTADLSEN
ncbi:N-acetyltransferase family protein (plasmid) [Glutamicibacter sp. FR1]|uniref:GNAT family N-acetyltransferase n=1 Tax=Glutamicibacter sp. FR1 TaxID=3393744 RepID=UPI0039AF46A0